MITDQVADLGALYRGLDRQLAVRDLEAIDTACLLTFPYPEDGATQEVLVETDEFTALCPWTGLPDYGTLTIRYAPRRHCLELKSLKYYLLSYRDVGIVQEHAADRLLRDLVAACQPWRMTVSLDYKVRGGLHTVTTTTYDGPDAGG